ncbi:hypothetical protein L2750_09380 [Shewanella submarina]|uniref:Uncharacterized protein n=1 Tax=Shewanella submarina TaxID=2016376 RepID=A0ABV7GCQ0_9GAMM|nr:hypothetical protein [Shewanella submarina]MCL1037365.1 hypothetical protein [Shewanella submarina]
MRLPVLMLVTGIVLSSFNAMASGSQVNSIAQPNKPNVVATSAMDKQAIAILCSLPDNRRIEQARAVMKDGSLIMPTRCTNHSCSFKIDTSKVRFVVHTHVKSNDDNHGVARLINKGRELPGPGDHAFLDMGNAPNYFLTPKGSIRVLEYHNGEYRVRTLSGDNLPVRHWQPYAGEPSLSEISRALRG